MANIFDLIRQARITKEIGKITLAGPEELPKISLPIKGGDSFIPPVAPVGIPSLSPFFIFKIIRGVANTAQKVTKPTPEEERQRIIREGTFLERSLVRFEQVAEPIDLFPQTQADDLAKFALLGLSRSTLRGGKFVSKAPKAVRSIFDFIKKTIDDVIPSRFRPRPTDAPTTKARVIDDIVTAFGRTGEDVSEVVTGARRVTEEFIPLVDEVKRFSVIDDFIEFGRRSAREASKFSDVPTRKLTTPQRVARSFKDFLTRPEITRTFEDEAEALTELFNTLKKTTDEGLELLAEQARRFDTEEEFADSIRNQLLQENPELVGDSFNLSVRKIDDLVPVAEVVDPSQVERVVGQIARREDILPIVVEGNTVIDGVHRLEAFRRAGVSRIPVLEITRGVGPEKAKVSGVSKVFKKAKEAVPEVKAEVEPIKVSKELVSEGKKGVREIEGKTVAQQTVATAKKDRGFIKTLRESPEILPALRQKLTGKTYLPLVNDVIEEAARKRVAKNLDEAEAFVLEAKKPDAEHTAVAIELIRRFQDSKNFIRAERIASTVAEALTKAGQQIQAAKLYSNLSKEGLLIRARKIVDAENKNRFRWQKKTVNLSEEFITQISELADARTNATDKIMREEIELEIGLLMESLKRISFLKKVSMTQTLGQLLNLVTWTRNVVGNELFFRVERLNKYPATLIDWSLSTAIPGRPRTITFNSAKQGEYWSSFFRGAKMGWAGKVPPGTPTQFDLPSAPVFRNPINPLYWAERLLGAGLRGFDFAAYNRGKNKMLGELGWLRAKNAGFKGKELGQKAVNFAEEADDNLINIAHNYGKYVTFQDDNIMAKGFTNVKRALNLWQDFGVGDLVLKYPRTPASLLMRGLEYSVAGFVRSAAILAVPIMKGRKVNQREVIMALSRAITGTVGLTGMGYFFASKGIITGTGEQDRDLNTLQRLHGTGKYKLNISALKRWVKSGFNDSEADIKEGDTLMTYDWAQPIALSISIGANMQEAQETGVIDAYGFAGTALESVEGGVNTLVEQPLVSGITRLFGYGNPVDGFVQAILGTPASFSPSLLRQINNWYDNTRRNSYDPDVLKQSLNWAKRKIPGFAQQLPPAVDQWGEEAEKFQGNSNNLFNVFFNPAFINKYIVTPESELVFDLFESAGELKQIPRIAPKKLNVDGEEIVLSAEQQNTYQKLIGEKTQLAFGAFAESQSFMDLSDNEKADMMAAELTNIAKEAKDEMFGTDTASVRTYEHRLNFLEVLSLGTQGREDDANDYVNKFTEEEFDLYKSLRATWRAGNTRRVKTLIKKNPVDAVLYVRALPESEQARILDNLSDSNWIIFRDARHEAIGFDDIEQDKKKLKEALSALASEQKSDGTVEPDFVLDWIVEWGKVLLTEPIELFKIITTGEELDKLTNGTVIFVRKSNSQIRKELGATKAQELDHIKPLQLGGDNSRDNLQLVDKELHRTYTNVGNYLGYIFRQGTISENEAQRILDRFRAGEITEGEILLITEDAFQAALR